MCIWQWSFGMIGNAKFLPCKQKGGALVGMSLLYGSRVTITVLDGGDITIEPIQ